MKSTFVLQFIDEMGHIIPDLGNLWLNTPYKGFRMSDTYSKMFRQGIINLEHRKLLARTQNGSYRFSENGKQWLRKTLIKYHRNIGTKWDGKWRIVLFDIPREREKQRHVFRAKLKSMGFQMLQKSVFAIPYPCEEELARICKHLKLTPYVEVITAETIGSKEDEWKKLFAL
jgi:phenylacetic acid degradation operon negative regulatory protein